MLHMYFVQHWFNLANQACKEALLDSTPLRRFVGIDLERERVPDGTRQLKCRRLLETHKPSEALFAKVSQVQQSRRLKAGTDTIVHATLISARSSTKNAPKRRDPEMHRTRKGRQWYFGMKLHIGVVSHTGLAHRAVVTTAKGTTSTPPPELLHGDERHVWGDSAHAREGRDVAEIERSKHRNKYEVRAWVEHVLAVVNDDGASPKCIAVAWPRTPRACLWPWA